MLTLNMSRSPGAGPQVMALQRVLVPWGESTSDATLEEGMGAPAATGDATWLFTFFNNTLWPVPGGSFATLDRRLSAV